MSDNDKQELRKLPQPEPSAGTDAYLRERELALAFSEKRRANYELYQQSARRSAKVNYLPVIIDIENVSRCNFRCIMCLTSDFEGGKRGPDMSLEDFKQLIDEQYGLVEIKLHGMGEPTLQGDTFFEMIRYARASHIWVRTVTNASLLHARDNYKKLVESGVNEIQISIDGATKEVYESIRRKGKFEMVTKNCLTINRYCKEKQLTLTKMWTVVQEANVHQLEQLVDLAAELEFPHLVFSLQVLEWGSEKVAAHNRNITAEKALSSEELLKLVVRGKQLGVKVAFWNTTKKFDTSSPTTLCPWPFERAYIASDLRTVPCCMIANPDLYEIGKPGESFLKVWQSQEFEDFRHSHLTGDVPEVCQNCYVCKPS